MDSLILCLTLLAAIITLIMLGFWVYASLIIVSIVSLHVVCDFDLTQISTIMAFILQRCASSWELSAIPLFVWMGELLLKTNISDQIFSGLAPIVRFMPGRLAHINVLGCTIFAAICGSSAATTATVGKITVNELERRGYKQSICLGSLAGAGSLGLLIPPSIVMIVYGVLAEVPIDKLFLAGVLPGLMVAGIFCVYIIIYALVAGVMRPGFEHSKEKDAEQADELHIKNVLKLLPVTAIILFVLGSIYTGFATPSEAAALGVLGVLIYAGITRSLTVKSFFLSLQDTLKTSVMIFAVILAATLMSTTFAYLHIPTGLANLIVQSNMSVPMFLLFTSLFFLLIGLILDGTSIMVMTLPIFMSIINVLGIDAIWFGIYMILMIEMGQITPPVGFNVMVIKSINNEDMGKLTIYCIPFFFLMCFSVFLLCYFPQIALYLPSIVSR